MGLYRSTQEDPDGGRRYNWRDWLLALGLAVSIVTLIGACTWQALMVLP